MGRTRYCRARDLDEVLTLLEDHGFDAKILAGGQSLVPMMSAGFVEPELLIDVNGLPGLDEVAISDGQVRIGALVRHRQLEHAGEQLREAVPALPLAARFVAHDAVRNRGTMVGSLVHADPSAEWPAVALALDATVRLVRAGGEREVGFADFVIGPLTSDTEPEEFAVEVRFPVAPARTGASVQELAYRHGDYAIVGVVAQLSVSADATAIEDARVSLFGVDAVPIRVTEAERLILDEGPASFGEAAALAREAASPSSDATASAEYRAEMIPVFTLRALQEAFEGAERGGPGRGG